MLIKQITNLIGFKDFCNEVQITPVFQYENGMESFL